jgi:hypothetical protein
MVGMFVSLCLASQKPSEWVFFVPAGTDLGVKLLTRKDGILRKAESIWKRTMDYNDSTYKCNYQDSMRDQKWKNHLPESNTI